jgi:hypothetical protein
MKNMYRLPWILILAYQVTLMPEYWNFLFSDIQVECWLDNIPKEQQKTDCESDSSETLNLQEGEDHPLEEL